MQVGGDRTIDVAEHVQRGGHCVIDIVGVFVRVSCPTETQTDRPR